MITYKKFAVISIAVLFVLSLGSIALAKGAYSLKGEVLSIDTAAKTLTVKAIDSAVTSPTMFKGDVPFVTNNKTQIAMGKKHETLASLKAGDMVKVVFHEKDGKNIANRILITSEPASK